jgi:hypothetical protein
MRSLAILPALIAMPAVANAAPMLVCAPADNLAEAIAEFRRLTGVYDRHPVHDLLMSSPDWDLVDEDSGQALNAIRRQLKICLRIPSRDGRDVATKIDLLRLHYQDFEIPDELLKIISTDARRLTGGM